MNTLHTAALVLEPQLAAHADEMFVVLSDPAIYEFENAPPASLAGLRERYTKLETRRSANGLEHWLNWVIRLPSDGLIGYVQATVLPSGHADIAYELASRHWGRGLARQAVQAMIDELAATYHVRQLGAVLKRSNHRSLRLLQRLGFEPATPPLPPELEIEPDEWRLQRAAPAAAHAG